MAAGCRSSTACGRSSLPEGAEERINQADPPGLSGFYFCLPIDNCVYCVYTVYIECVQFDHKEYSQMEIYLSNSGQEPIYAQITRQIKQQILSGQLHEGDAPVFACWQKNCVSALLPPSAPRRTSRPRASS